MFKVICLSLKLLSVPNHNFACKYIPLIIKESKKNKIDPITFISLIHVESRWNPRVKSKAGACGLTQVIPRYSYVKTTCKKLKNPKKSILIGIKILARWIHKYGKGNEKIGLCGYSSGRRCRGKNPLKQGMNYAVRILRLKKKIYRVISMLQIGLDEKSKKICIPL